MRKGTTLSPEKRAAASAAAKARWAALPEDEKERRRRTAFGNDRKAPKADVSRETSKAAPPGGKGSVVAIGNLFWLAGSLPMGIVSPAGGLVMRTQIPQAGRQIDTLLKGTALYESLAQGGRGDKVVTGFNLLAPPLLAVMGDQVHRMSLRDPDNPRIAEMEGWIEQMLRQLMAYQGINLPAAPVREPPVQRSTPPPREAPEPPIEPADEGDGLVPVGVAREAAAASRFDHVE